MSSHESVTQWLDQLKQGDPLAAQKLWQRYVEKLIRLARRKLGESPRRVADEEDVVVAAFASFCRGVDEGRFSRLDDRDDLWTVLLVLTERKAFDQLRRQYAEKRGAGQVRGESAFEPFESGECPAPGLSQYADGGPTPAFAAEAAEQFRVLLDQLQDENLRRLAIAKMDGYSNEDIAKLFGIGLRTVERRLRLIRQIWDETHHDD